jgi:hypothetical protein
MKGINIVGMKTTLSDIEESTFGDVLKYSNKKILAIVMETLNQEARDTLKQNIKNSKISRKEGRKLFKKFVAYYKANKRFEEIPVKESPFEIDWVHDYEGLRETIVGMEDTDLADILKFADEKSKYLAISILTPKEAKKMEKLIKKSTVSEEEGKKLFEDYNKKLLQYKTY